MALLADDGWIQVSELAEEDSGIQELAQREGVDLAAKLKLAVTRVRADVESFLRKNSEYGIRHAVVDWSSWRWALTEALSSAYRDAYFHQLNDRYEAKWKLYAQQSTEAKEQCVADGIGVVYAPLPRPAAPELELVAGDHAARTYWVALSWMAADGTESSVGEPRLLKATGSHEFVARTAQEAPAGAGWHLYAGAGPTELSRQTEMAIEASGTWTLPAIGLVDGPPPQTGQRADSRVRMRRVLRRRLPTR